MAEDMREYYPDNRLYLTYTVQNGLLNGAVKQYFPNGKLAYEENYKAGKLNGRSRYYECSTSDDRCLIAKDIKYVNGKLHGEAIYYNYHHYEEMTKTSYKNGAKDGLERIYQDGQLNSESLYKQDIIQYRKSFYDGALYSEAIYKQGLPYTDKVFRKNGILHEEWLYENGKQIKHTIYYENGAKQREEFYGEKPRKIYYNPDGSVKPDSED
jgi:antitoxin component YwqK of YwqJK toxin-antitoxin module